MIRVDFSTSSHHVLASIGESQLIKWKVGHWRIRALLGFQPVMVSFSHRGKKIAFTLFIHSENFHICRKLEKGHIYELWKEVNQREWEKESSRVQPERPIRGAMKVAFEILLSTPGFCQTQEYLERKEEIFLLRGR